MFAGGGDGIPLKQSLHRLYPVSLKTVSLGTGSLQNIVKYSKQNLQSIILFTKNKECSVKLRQGGKICKNSHMERKF